MPQKETRESIEAELNASKRERIALQLLELVSEAHLVEKDLRALEDEHGIPEFARSRTLPERMAAVGMSRAVIDRVQMMLDALDMVRPAIRREPKTMLPFCNSMAAGAGAAIPIASAIWVHIHSLARTGRPWASPLT